MRRLSLRAPSPALIISVIALFAALGGTSYAAATIGTSDIKDRAVTNAKLGQTSVGFQKVRLGAIHTENIANNAVGNGQLANSAVGTSKLNVRFISASTVVANGAEGVITANCPTGTSPLNGGGGFGAIVGTLLQTSQATSAGWQVTGLNYGSGAPRLLTAQATCITP
jgi:hypothetical protein